jgi:hypothetical protein
MRLPNLSAGVVRTNFVGTDAAAREGRGVEPSKCNNIAFCTTNEQCGAGCVCNQDNECVLQVR